MSPKLSTTLRLSALVAAVTAAALGVRFALDPILDHRQPFCTFLAAVGVAAWYGGVRAALAALALGALAGLYFFVGPQHSLVADEGDIVGLLIFVAIGLTLGLVISRLRAARVDAERLNAELARSAIELKTLLEVMPIGLTITRDTECREVLTSAAFARQFGAAAGTGPRGPPPRRW